MKATPISPTPAPTPSRDTLMRTFAVTNPAFKGNS